ncbi:ABC transporter ATP-binding protein [Clostridium sp. UBA6640]|uniref:ABC transporter ATP-binding protein n=1 Tax=Clostridium sp. UBA6640 TaxID=1946370 RepID=UPI0025C25EB5|nr:ABC transporter ATP-binding protein [Clostridium sp. UBA6640]
MNEVVLKLKNVTKSYSGKVAVDNVNMTIRRGDIYGLIGRNGAGKTTLTRLITSLTFADSGEIELFGETTESGLQEARKRLGCVIEIPALYPNLTAYQNLEYYQRLKGIPDKNAIIKTLEIVGLSDTGEKKVKNFSLGMKQRLGIALALLNNPDFIILDEPINGLDPMGIIEMREIIKRLNEEYHITIMISSHILTELSLVATHYGIIDEGRMVKEFTHEELTEQCQRSLAIMVDDTAKAASVFETVLHTKNFKVISGKEIRLYDYLDNSSEVNQQLVSSGVSVASITEVGDNLEDYFMSLVKGRE